MANFCGVRAIKMLKFWGLLDRYLYCRIVNPGSTAGTDFRQRPAR